MIVKDIRGIVLVLALLLILILSVLVASIVLITNSEIWGTMNYRLLVQARYTAESGAQQTENWIIHSYAAPASITTCTGGVTTNCYTLTTRPVQYTHAAGTAAAVVLSGISGVAANYSDTTVQTSYNTALSNQSIPGISNASFSTSATLMAMQAVVGFGSGNNYLQSWQITSQGNVTGVRNSQVQVIQTMDRTASPIFSGAVFSTAATCGAITFSGNAITDSFDSGTGTYAATRQTSNGNVGTNGNLTIGGGSTVNGSVSTPKVGTGTSCNSGTPNALNITGGSFVTAGVVAIAALTYANPPAPSPTPPTTAAVISGLCGTVAGCTVIVPYTSVALAPGQYGNLNVSGGVATHLVAGTYNINSLVMSNGSSLVIDSGPAILNIAGAGVSTAVDLSGGAITNGSGKPANLQLLYAGTADLRLSGGTGNYGLVYAPNAPITMSGGANWYGSVLGATVNDSGGTSVHYDMSLRTNAVRVGNYVGSSFSWSKF